jgi:hypothetical protein
VSDQEPAAGSKARGGGRGLERRVAPQLVVAMNNWSDEEINDPLIADFATNRSDRSLLLRPYHLSGFRVDKMQLRARQACDRLIRCIVVGHLVGGPSLYCLGGVRAAIKKRHRHQMIIAQTKRRPPALEAPKYRSGGEASASAELLSTPSQSRRPPHKRKTPLLPSGGSLDELFPKSVR